MRLTEAAKALAIRDHVRDISGPSALSNTDNSNESPLTHDTERAARSAGSSPDENRTQGIAGPEASTDNANGKQRGT